MKYKIIILFIICILFLILLKTKEKFYNNNYIQKVQIFGERCSGTNYLENIILKNFNVTITWECGFKHFFGFDEDKYNDKILFICIVRNPIDWINSLYVKKWHLPDNLNKKDNFLNKEFYSINDENSGSKDYSEIMKDRNIYTNKRYKNIFELRHTKNKYLIDTLPKKVKNYLFIRYEDLINDFDNTMYKIKNKNLKLKKNIKFPENIIKKDIKFKLNKKNKYLIYKNEILNNVNFNNKYELKLNYLELIKIGLIIPTTSNKRNYKNIKEIDFFKILINSFKKIINNNYVYKFYLGYDDDDIFYNKNKNDIINYFYNLKLKNTSIKLIKIKNKKGKVGNIWSDLADIALNDECEYLYQIGDDIKLLTSNWEKLFINKLRKQHNIGVVGPKDINNNKILTQSFVHKTHLKIFKRYFPEELKNWYIDDWITNVYMPNYSYKFEHIHIQNTGGYARYNIVNDKQLYLKILEKDKKIFDKYIKINKYK